MNKRVVAALFSVGALTAPVTFSVRAVAQQGQEDQSKRQAQQARQERNTNQEQRQSWNGDYRYEETVDRNWLNEQRQDTQKKPLYPSWDTNYRYEETVDRNWLNERGLDR